jgi:hypothetical protein
MTIEALPSLTAWRRRADYLSRDNLWLAAAWEASAEEAARHLVYPEQRVRHCLQQADALVLGAAEAREALEAPHRGQQTPISSGPVVGHLGPVRPWKARR